MTIDYHRSYDTVEITAMIESMADGPGADTAAHYREPPSLDWGLREQCETPDDFEIFSEVFYATKDGNSPGAALAAALRPHVPASGTCQLCHSRWPCSAYSEAYMWIVAFDAVTGLRVTCWTDHAEGEICWPPDKCLPWELGRCTCASSAEAIGKAPPPGRVSRRTILADARPAPANGKGVA